MTTSSPPVIDDSALPILVSAARAPVSSPGNGKAATLLDTAFNSKPDTDPERRLKKRPWYWVLAAACAIAFVVYSAVVYGPRFWKPQLAIEQRITANPSEAPVTGAVVSPDGKYVAYSDTTGVYMRHIDSGDTRHIFDAVPISWFPDSTHLLLSVVADAQKVPSLWKVSISWEATHRRLSTTPARGEEEPGLVLSGGNRNVPECIE